MVLKTEKKLNPKAVAANAKKAAAQEVKDKAAAAELEKQTAEAWKVGSNTRGAAKEEAAAARERERLRAAAEKAELLAQEDAAAGAVKVGKVKKAKKKDDVSALLSEGLAKAPKTKVEKEAEAKKKAKAAARKKQAEDEEAAKSKVADPLAPAPLQPNLNRASSSFFDEGTPEGSNGGRQADDDWGEEEISASGLDAALEAMSVAQLGGGGGSGPKPESQKAAFLAFEDRTLPQLREEAPGLRRAQYRDKCFKLWAKSPENPLNQTS